jgi:hypothetical protein
MDATALNLSSALAIILALGVHPARPGGTVLVEDGQVFSGPITCDDFHVPSSVTAWVEGDFVLQAAGEVVIRGTVRTVDRALGSEHSDGPRITILAGKQLYIAPGGALLGGRGKSYPDSPDQWLGLPGGEGSSIFIDATLHTILGEVRAGAGGDGARGGRGGRGGNVWILGSPGSHPEPPPDAGPGMVRSGAGGSGGQGFLSALVDAPAGDGGEAGSVSFKARERVAEATPGSNPESESEGGAWSCCRQSPSCPDDHPGTDVHVQAVGGDGGDGGDGSDGTEASPSGRRGGNGGAGGSVTASSGTAGGSGADCCNPPATGGSGGNGGKGGDAKGGRGGQGGKGGNAFSPAGGQSYNGPGGDGGNGGAAGNATSGAGGSGGKGGSGCNPGTPGAGGAAGVPTTQDPGAPGQPGNGDPGGAPGSPGNQGSKTYGTAGAPGGQGANCCGGH